MSTSARVTTRVTSRPIATPPTVSRRPIRTDIQGLRALAIILVLLNHAGAPFVAGGFVGVDVFFVISGFLISTHLLESLHNTGRIHFLRFYVARARRILPAALVTIAATAVASFFVVSPLRITEILHDGIAAALYVPNVVFAVRETNYLAGTAPSPFQHFWSLGVEEQFYLVWPVLLFALFLLTRGSRRRMPLMLTGVGVIAVASCVAGIIATTDAPSLAFFSPHTRAWEFAVGALIAGTAPTLKLVPTYLAHALSWVGLVMVVFSAVAYSAATHYPGWAALLPVIGTATVIAFGTSASGRAAPSRGAVAILGLRPLQFIGAISYSLYLVHWPIVTLVHEHVGLGQPLPLAAGLLLAALSIPLAWLMFRFVETPFRTSRRAHPGTGRRMLVAGAATTLVLVGSLVAAGTAAAQLPLTSDRVQAQGTPTPLPEGTPFVPRNISPSLTAATGDTGLIYRNGCQQRKTEAALLTCTFGAEDSPRTIALFGDSHAGRWFPALDSAAENLNYRLDTFTKSGCRSEETSTAWATSANTSCLDWRDAAVARLVADPPDVIVLANHLGPKPDVHQGKLEADWTEGISALLDRLPASSQVIMLADTPEFPSSPVLCLASHLGDAGACAVSRDAALNPAIRNAQLSAAASHGDAVIDLTDYFCNATDCPAIIGSTLVYSDEHHVTATFSRTLAPVLQDALARNLEPVG